jgi:hypothetical protein
MIENLIHGLSINGHGHNELRSQGEILSVEDVLKQTFELEWKPFSKHIS